MFGNTLTHEEKGDLCTLIYYPHEKLALVREARQDSPNWYKRMLDQLLRRSAPPIQPLHSLQGAQGHPA